MIQTALIDNAHNDLVTDACYDFYGLCLATCGLDQRIKIWALNEETGQWKLDDEWKAHDATVTKLSWAHPIFGPVIASGSFDRTVKIWEQMHLEGGVESSSSGMSSGTSKWSERAVLLEAKASVRAVEFAPHHFGLKLASISADNHLRIYECLEQPALSSWQLVDEADVPSLSATNGRSGSSIVTTTAPGTPTPAAAGAITFDGASVSNMLQSAQQQQALVQPNRPGAGSREADGGWCVSWCKERYWGEVLAVGAGVSGVVKIVQLSAHRRPQALLALEPSPPSPSNAVARIGQQSRASGHAAAATGPTGNNTPGEAPYAVTSVAWAPSCGRSFHLIATGSRDGCVRIWKVRPPPPSSSLDGMSNGMDEDDVNVDLLEEKWTANLVAEFDDHKSSVGRVEWNVTGTLLSSSGNDGRIRLWKQTAGGVWRLAGTIDVEQKEERPQVDDVNMGENGASR